MLTPTEKSEEEIQAQVERLQVRSSNLDLADGSHRFYCPPSLPCPSPHAQRWWFAATEWWCLVLCGR